MYPFRIDKPRSLRKSSRRRGLTLTELLIASSVVALLSLGMASLAITVETANSYAKNTGTATQHARVVIGRIERTLYEAHASEQFPGFAAFSETHARYKFPENLVVWKPNGSPSDPGGLPLYSELVILCPGPNNPNELLEITVPGDNDTVPPLSDTSAWLSELASIKSDPTATKVQLTDLLRTVSAPGGTTRGAVRFVVTVRPTEAEWSDYQSGDLDWEDIAWVQNIYGFETGLRQAWCRFELQLMPGEQAVQQPDSATPLPFFGSAAIYYELHK